MLGVSNRGFVKVEPGKRPGGSRPIAATTESWYPKPCLRKDWPLASRSLAAASAKVLGAHRCSFVGLGSLRASLRVEQHARRFGAERLPEVVTLGEVAAHPHKLLVLLSGLHTLGYNLQAQRVHQVDHTLGQHRSTWFFVERTYEGAVD